MSSCRLFICALSVVAAGCAPLTMKSQLQQQENVALSASIGSEMLRVTRSSPLPNAFGRADLFGGTVDRGFVSLRFQGYHTDGSLVFRVVDIETRSNETTMSRYGGSHTNITAQRYGNTVYATAQTYSAPRGSTTLLSPNTTEFRLPAEFPQEFEIHDVTIKLLGSGPTSVRYKLERRHGGNQ